MSAVLGMNVKGVHHVGAGGTGAKWEGETETD